MKSLATSENLRLTERPPLLVLWPEASSKPHAEARSLRDVLCPGEQRV